MKFIPLGIGDVAISLILMAAVILLSLRHRLGLEKDLVVGTLRTFIQLVAVGYILRFVFSLNHPVPVLLMLLAMTAIAVHNGVQRQTLKFHGMIVVMGISIGLVTIAILAIVVIVVIKAKPWFQPQVMIPIAGMTIASSMNAATLAINRFSADLKLRKKEVETALALGASPRVAVQPLLKDAAKAAMLPSINALMIVGVVQLPGMMSGQILSGIDPIQAINYQIVVMYMIAASAAFTSYAILFQSYRRFFTSREQLLPGLFRRES
jgi:putative ABC transport system permease protein